MLLNGFVSYNNASVYICIETGYMILTVTKDQSTVVWGRDGILYTCNIPGTFSRH